MSVVIANVNGAKVRMVADTLISDDNHVSNHTTKIWKPADNMMIGFAGDITAFSYLRYAQGSVISDAEVEPGEWQDVDHDTMWLYNNFHVPLWRAAVDMKAEYAMLVALNNNLYYMDNEGGFFQYKEKTAAVGSGAVSALAYFEGVSYGSHKITKELALKAAVKYACHVTTTCQLPLEMLSYEVS